MRRHNTIRDPGRATDPPVDPAGLSGSSSYAEPMSVTSDPHRPAQNPAVTEAFRQIADVYVEASRELTESDPDLCLDVPEPPHATARRTSDWS